MPELVSVTIPTLNSAKTLAATLDSVSNQTYDRVELIIADSYSRDDSLRIAAEFGATVVKTRNKLLGARFDAYSQAKGRYVLLLDSDQILPTTALERCVAQTKDYDMIALGELTFGPHTYIQ